MLPAHLMRRPQFSTRHGVWYKYGRLATLVYLWGASGRAPLEFADGKGEICGWTQWSEGIHSEYPVSGLGLVVRIVGRRLGGRRGKIVAGRRREVSRRPAQ